MNANCLRPSGLTVGVQKTVKARRKPISDLLAGNAFDELQTHALTRRPAIQAANIGSGTF